MAEIDGNQIAKLASLIVVLQDVVDALRGQSATISAASATKIEKYRKESLCLFCDQPLEGKTTRGCHQVCYTKVQRRINRGEITMQHAVDKGWINPVPEPPGRKSDRPDPMRQSFKGVTTEILAEVERDVKDIVQNELPPEPTQPPPGRRRKASK